MKNHKFQLEHNISKRPRPRFQFVTVECRLQMTSAPGSSRMALRKVLKINNQERRGTNAASVLQNES